MMTFKNAKYVKLVGGDFGGKFMLVSDWCAPKTLLHFGGDCYTYIGKTAVYGDYST